MGLQSPVNAHTASTGLACFSPSVIPSSQLYRHGFMGAPVHLRFSSEKLQLTSKGQLVHTLSAQAKHGRTSGVSAVSEFSQQAIAVDSEEVEAAQSAENVSGFLKDSGPAGLIPPESSTHSLSHPEMSAPPLEFQGVPPSVGGLNEPSSSTVIELKVAPGDGPALTDAVPPSPDASLLNQNPDLESIRSSAEASLNAAGAAVDSSQEAATVAGDSLVNAQPNPAKEAYEALLSGARSSVQEESSPLNSETASQASKAVSDALMDAKSSISNAVSTSQETVFNFFTKIQDSIQSSVDGATSAVKSTYDNINGSIVNSVKSITGSYEKSVTDLESAADETLHGTQESAFDVVASAFRMGTPANNALKEVVTTIESAVGTALVATGKLASDAYSSTKESLPVDVQAYLGATENKLSELAGPVGSALQQVYVIITDAERAVGIDPQNPIIPVILVIGGTVFVGLIYWQTRYGGYSGDLAPTSALELLRKEGNIVLVDIRSEDLREREGIPDLRRQARFKFANVEAVKVEGSLRRLLKNVNDVDASITAAIIKNLRSVQFNTKVIVMDADGSTSKNIARALKKTGIKRPYRIDGGFRSWTADGLRVKQTGAETPLTIIKEETEAIWEELTPTPGGVAAIAVGLIAGVYALIEWEKTLQFLGLVGIGQVLYSRFNSYESVEDMKADLRVVLRPLTLATQGILWIAGQVEPSKLQLATSPSTSAVQDRVLQAAAKHGPLPSELDQQQLETQPLEEAAPEGVDASSPQE